MEHPDMLSTVQMSGPFVIPAEAGIQLGVFWTNASAGVTYLFDLFRGYNNGFVSSAFY